LGQVFEKFPKLLSDNLGYQFALYPFRARFVQNSSCKMQQAFAKDEHILNNRRPLISQEGLTLHLLLNCFEAD
jgi:hypothetical protein